jgi:hypothetical protein
MKLGLNNKALKRLEPYEAKVSSTVLRGRRDWKLSLCYPTWLKKQPKNKHIGDLSIGDFIEMCRFLAKMKHGNNKDQNCSNKNQERKEIQMQQVNDNFKEILKNGEPRSVIDEYCRQLGIPNMPEYVDAIEAYGEKRLAVLTPAGMHFLIDRKLKETGNLSEDEKHLKRHVESLTGKRGELKMFNKKEEE